MCRNSFFVEDTHNCKLHRVSCPASCFRSDHSTACRERSPNLEFQHLFDVFSCPYSHFVPWPTAAGQTCKIGTLKALLHLATKTDEIDEMMRKHYGIHRHQMLPFKFLPRRHRCSHPWTASCHHRIVPQAEPRSQLCPRCQRSSERHKRWEWEKRILLSYNVLQCLTMSCSVFPASTSPYFSKLSILATPSPQIGRHTARKTVRFAAAGSPQSQGSFRMQSWSILNCSAWTLQS